MSEYSHGIDLMHWSTGFPFCRGDTMMLDPDPRCGRAWGVGWTTFTSEGLAVRGARLSRS